jgi:hypothetical protein
MEDQMMIERERRRINDPPRGNGIDASAPLRDRLHEQERRISTALTEPRTATDLADLLDQTDLAVVAATEHAKLENDRALDPLESPDPQAARQCAEDAAFMANRLRTMRPRLLARLQQVTAQEALAAYRAKQTELAPERDALQRELAETYQAAASKLVDLFTRIRAFQQRAQQALGNPPPGVEPLPALDGTRVLDTCVLPEFAQPDRNAWPLPSSFASDFATSMRFDTHPGQHWTDPDVQQRRRAELEAEQQKNAEYHQAAAREQEARVNRQERERFSAQQRQ